MRRTLLAAAVTAGALFGGGQAWACGAENFQRALIHNAIPHALPDGWIVSDVRFRSTDLEGLEESGVVVDVRQMTRGNYTGRTMRVILATPNSCSAPFKNGMGGWIVGVPLGIRNGELVVGLIEAGEADGFRLPEDTQVDERLGRRLERLRARVAAAGMGR